MPPRPRRNVRRKPKKVLGSKDAEQNSCSSRALQHLQTALCVPDVFFAKSLGPLCYLIRPVDSITAGDYKVTLGVGERHTCTCTQFLSQHKPDLCIHICWVLVCVLKMAPQGPLTRQLGFGENHPPLSPLLERRMKVKVTQRKVPTGDFQDRKEPIRLTEDSNCPVCMESTYMSAEIKYDITTCQYCGQYYHVTCVQRLITHNESAWPHPFHYNDYFECSLCRKRFDYGERFADLFLKFKAERRRRLAVLNINLKPRTECSYCACIIADGDQEATYACAACEVSACANCFPYALNHHRHEQFEVRTKGELSWTEYEPPTQEELEERAMERVEQRRQLGEQAAAGGFGPEDYENLLALDAEGDDSDEEDLRPRKYVFWKWNSPCTTQRTLKGSYTGYQVPRMRLAITVKTTKPTPSGRNTLRDHSISRGHPLSKSGRCVRCSRRFECGHTVQHADCGCWFHKACLASLLQYSRFCFKDLRPLVNRMIVERGSQCDPHTMWFSSATASDDNRTVCVHCQRMILNGQRIAAAACGCIFHYQCALYALLRRNRCMRCSGRLVNDDNAYYRQIALPEELNHSVRRRLVRVDNGVRNRIAAQNLMRHNPEDSFYPLVAQDSLEEDTPSQIVTAPFPSPEDANGSPVQASNDSPVQASSGIPVQPSIGSPAGPSNGSPVRSSNGNPVRPSNGSPVGPSNGEDAIRSPVAQ